MTTIGACIIILGFAVLAGHYRAMMRLYRAEARQFRKAWRRKTGQQWRLRQIVRHNRMQHVNTIVRLWEGPTP